VSLLTQACQTSSREKRWEREEREIEKGREEERERERDRERERRGERERREREKRSETTRLKRRDPVHEHYGMTPPNVIPNLFRDLCFDPLGGRRTLDGQRSLQQRSAGFGS